jgi:acetolactate synthase-1/2/3 large subunit
VAELVQRAAHVAVTGRPRPVMVSLPLDVQTRDVGDPGLRPAFAVADPVAPEDEIARAAALLAAGRRPVLLVGGGAERSGARDATAALAEWLGAPVVASWHRKAAFPDWHPHFAGVLGLGALEVTEQVVRVPDVLLALGCRFSQFTTRRWTLVGPETQVLQVDVDAEELGRAVTPAVALHGDAAATARALHACLDAGPRWEGRDDAARLQAIRAAYLEGSRVPLRDAAEAGSGVCSAAVVRALRDAMATHDPAFVLDATTFGIWMQRHLPVERAGSWFGNAGGAMGWGLPAAMGIKLARPHERVLAVVGDGSFWTVAQDLETAVREGIPVVCLVTNNFAYGNIRDRQRVDHGGRLVGVVHDNPDFAAVARLLGAHGERVERADDLGPAIDRAFAAGLPAVTDVIQDPAEGLPPGVRPPSTTETQDA